MRLILNGQDRDFPTLSAGASVADLIRTLELKGDRVAIEVNGAIVPRAQWPTAGLAESDRIEMVHFVGGGLPATMHRPRSCALFFLIGLTFLLSFAAAHSEQLTADDENAPSFVVNDIRAGQPLRILVYGDMRFTDPANTSDTWPLVRKWLAQKVADEKPDAMLVTGDIPFHGSNAADWQVFEEESASWRLNHLRVYPTVGNHEVIPYARPGYRNYFKAFPQLNGYHVYSVLLGNVYLITLDTVEPIWPKGYQAEWLQAQLDHMPPQVDFVFIQLHVPMIADTQSEFLVNIPSPDLVGLREYLEKRAATMRQKFIVVSGHIHNYERFEEKGITHVISGGGGAKPYPIYVRGPEDQYRDPAYPNFNYVIFTIRGTRADAEMFRIADPTAHTLSVEVKDRFSVEARPAVSTLSSVCGAK